MLDALREFLIGPVFVFSIAVAILGLLRLIFLHVYLIVTAFYNSWNHTKNHSNLIKKVLCYGLPHKFMRLKPEVGPVLLVCAYAVIFILPFFVLDHISLLEKYYGIRLVAFSKPFSLLLIIVPLVFAIVKIRKSLISSNKKVGSKNDLWFWSLIFIVFITGALAQNVNHPILLRIFRVMHVLTGDSLIFIIPFSRIGNWLLYPLINITCSGSIWLLPTTEKRNETAAYFKGLMEKQQ